MNPSFYTVGSTSPYAGKSLNQINAGGYQGVGFNPQDFAKYLGVGADTPLSAGMQLNYNGGVSQGDTEMVNKLFTPQTQNDREQAAVQPAINTLQASKDPLKQRYSDLINQIKDQQDIATNRQTVSTNNELARRGIVGGGLYDREMTNALNPVTQQYTGLIQNTGNQQNLDLNSVDQAIAQLQAGAGKSSIQDALQQLQMQQQQSQFNAQNQIAQAQLALQQKQSNYIPVPGLGIYDIGKKNLLGGFSQTGLSPSGYQVVGQY